MQYVSSCVEKLNFIREETFIYKSSPVNTCSKKYSYIFGIFNYQRHILQQVAVRIFVKTQNVLRIQLELFWKMNSISIIHLRCIKEVFSDATVFIADFGLFLHHIGSDSNPGMTSTKTKKIFHKGQTSAVLIDICPLENSQWK